MQQEAVTFHVYGAGTVQGEGTIGTKRFYFRAKHDSWTFSVADSDEVDPVDVQLPGQGFLVGDRYGPAGDFAASYMDERVAERIIRLCAALYLDLSTLPPPDLPGSTTRA